MKATTSFLSQTTQNTQTNAMKVTRQTKTAPAATRKSARILSGSVAALLTVAAVGTSARAATINWDFFSGGPTDLQGWTSISGGVMNYNGGVSASSSGADFGGYAHDGGHVNVLFRSPTFELDGSGALSFGIEGGQQALALPGNVSGVAIGGSAQHNNGFQGVALREVSTGNYVLTKRRSNDGGGFESLNWTVGELSTYANNGQIYTVEYVDTDHGGWGWSSFDQVAVPGFLSSGAPTQIWANGADGDWSTGIWNPVNPTTPDNTTKTQVDTAYTVTVDGARTTQQFTALNQGKLLIGGGNSLTVNGAISVATVSSGSGVTMAGNSTLSAQSGSIASLSAGGNVTINVTGAGQTITVPVYTASAASVLTKGGVGTLALTNTALSTDPLGASTTGIVLNGGTLSLDNSTTVTTNNALKANLYYNPYNPSQQLRFHQAGTILDQTPVATVSDTGLGNSNGAGINYNGNNDPNQNGTNAFRVLFPSITQYDNFQVAWTGFLTAPASGGFNLNSYWADNAYSVYVDLNQDGVFTSNEMRNEANAGGGAQGGFNLTGGQRYKIALGFAEEGGDQNVGWRIYGPGGYNDTNVNPSAGNQAGMWSYDTTTYGALNMAGKSLTVTASSTLQLGTDQAVTFGALNANGGTATITGAVPSVSFTSTTVPGAITSGISAASNKTITLGPVSIGAGGTLVVGGQATATSTTLTASGGVQVSSGGTYNVGTYTDGAITRTFTTGGAGTTALNNSGGAIVAADTTFRVEGGTLDATNSGVNDPLGGSTSIQLAGGKLKLQGVASVVNGLTASLYYTPNRDSIRFHNPGSLFTMTAVQTVTDTGLGNSNGVGINYNGDAAWQVLFPAKAQNDNFSVLWTGYLNAPANGTYNLNSYWGDDAYSVYVDLNQDTVFTADEMRSESGLGGGQGSFSLTGGQAYKVALGFREDGGRDNVGYKIYGPGAYNDTNVDPTHANQAGMWTSVGYGALSFGTKDIEVLANSELNALSDVSATFGALTLTNGVLTLTGNPLTSFSVTSVAGAATQVGLISSGEIVSGPIFGNAFTGTFVKGGSGNLTLNAANNGLGNATFDVQAGRLTALSAVGFGGSTNVKLSGGQLFLSSNGGDQAYDIGMDVTQNSTLTVGKDTVGGVNAPVNVTLGSAAKTLTVRNGKTLTVNATDSYTLDLNNSLAFEDNAVMTISGAGVDVNILGATTISMNNGSTLNLNAGTMHTNHAISVYNLNLNGGVLSLEGAGVNKSLHVNGTLTVNNGATNLDLTAGALLTTAGNATINLVNGTITTDSALNVGNLTVESGGTLNRVGALPADRNVSVGDKLRLVNKSFSTVGSALSVGNRIELVNSTLAFDNNLSLGTVNMDNYSVFSPGAGTTTTLSGNLEMYNHSSANFTGSTLAMTNRLDVRGYSTLTIANPLTLNGDLEFQDHAIVDFGSNVLTTDQDRELRINDGSELRVPNASNLNIRYLEIQGGTLTAGSVNIRDRIYFSGRDSRTNNNVHSFNITQESANRYIDVNGDSIRRNPADGSTDTYLTGTNTYTGNTNIGNAAVLVANEGVGLPVLSTVRFRDGVLGTSGTFTREIGANEHAGQVYWDNQGGFAAYGGNLTVSLTPQGGSVNGQLYYGSNNQGFNGQRLYLGSTKATHDETITNPIEINSGTDIQTWSRSRMATLSGNLTGSNEIIKNEGPGALALTGNNSGYTGNMQIRRGAIDVGTNGVGLGGTNVVYLRHDTGDPWTWGAANIQANGVLNKNIGQSAGEIYWEHEGGGFAARGGNLSVTLEGGANIDWNDSNAGFNGRQLMFGSYTADSVVTLTNNLNAQNSYRRITVIGNDNSPNDKAVLSGTLTDFRGFELRGTGTLEIPHDFTDIHDDQLRVYQGTLSVLGNVRSGNAYGGGDPRHIGSSDNNIEIREGGKLIVTGNAQGNFISIEDNGTVSDTSNISITGNLNVRDRIETSNGTMSVGGNATTGENYNIRNKSNVVITGNARVGAPNGDSADRDVYVENGGDLTFNGNVQTNRLQATGKNSNGRASTIHVNGIATVGNTGTSNMHFNADNPTTGGGLDGSGTVNFNFANFENRARLGGTLTLNVKDRIVFEGNNGILAPGNSAGTLTVNGSLTLNGGSSYYFDAGDMVNVNVFAGSNTGSELHANDGWNLVFKTGGSTFATGGSIELFHYTNLNPSFDITPNYNVADLITAGWIPNNFDTNTLSITASSGVVTLFGLQRQPIVWTGGGGDNDWTTGTNWATAVSAGNVLTFAGNVRLTPNNSFAALTSFAGLEFNGSAGAFTVGGNALDLTGGITNSSSNAQVVNVPIQLANAVSVNTGGQNMTLGGVLSGAGGVTKTGAGTIYITGANTNTGTTRIEAGVLAVANDANLGAGGATLQFAGGTLAPSAALTTSRPVNVAAGTSTLDTTGGNTTFNGAISGAGTLNKEGIGTLSLTGTSTFTGTTNVNAGGLVATAAGLGGNVVLSSTNVTFEQAVDGTTAASVSGTGNLIKNGAGVLTVAAPHTYNGQTQINVGTLRLSGTIITNGIYETILDASHDGDAANNIEQMRTYAAGPLGTGDGQGILTTQFNYPNDGSFTARMNVLNPGNTFDENDFSAVWTTTFGPTAAGQWDFKFDNNDDTASIWVDKDQDGIFESSGAQGDERIADRGGCCGGAEGGWSGFTNGQQYLVGFAMSDSGGGGYLDNVQFRGGGGAFSSYTGINPTGAGQSGLWSVVAGSPPNLLPIGTTVVMAASTTFDVNGAIQQIAALSGPANTSVTLGAGGNLTVSGSADASYGGVISGAGTLTKSGSNTLTLSGVNTHTVATVVNQGTLSVGADTALGATGSGGAKLKFTGGTLQTTASITSDRPVEVSTGGGTFDSNGFNSTLSGAYSGTGSLTKDGVGTLSLTGTSTNTAAMNVNGGTLHGNTESLKGNVVLANTSTVAFNQTTNGTYTKDVSGAGHLTKEGNAVLTVQGDHSYTGETIITGGTLKLEANPGFRYYRFQGDLSVDNNNEYQLSELAFYSAGTNNINGTRRIPVGFFGQPSANYGDSGITGVYDDDLGTKCFMNGNGGQPIWATFDFGTAFAATGYDWATANDSTPGRNPNNWTVYASNDNSTFTLIDTRTGQGTSPTNTFTYAAGWALNLGGGGSGSDLLPVGTTVTMSTGTTLDLNNIDQQVGALADAGGGPTGHQVNLAGTTLKIGNAGNAETVFSGAIIGTGTDAIEKNGTSIQTLDGDQQYDTLTVVDGTLNVNGAVGITPANGTASVAVSGGGTLKFGSVSQTLNSLTIGAGSTVVFTSGTASGAFSGGGGKAPSFGGTAAVPEPGTLGLLLVGALGVLNRRRRQA